ncbi:unnamed protein product [Paramecium octaurelia]|uniref:Transmembrane protein n=1 Tax=Paramecium octaurelia TaxID=43137 RepID=A0A8S1YMN8_PAROT|nr:unnamed protein product [Paramecium octaurelia]
MNTGVRFISEDRNQDLVYCFPLEGEKNPFKKNKTSAQQASVDQKISYSLIKTYFILKVMGLMTLLFGIIYLILMFQGQNSILQKQLFNAQTQKITRGSFFFGFILVMDLIAILIYQINFKEVTANNIEARNPNKISWILFALFSFSFILSGATLGYYFLIRFDNGTSLVISSIFYLFMANLLLVIYLWYKKQEYSFKNYMIFIAFLSCIFWFFLMIYFIDIWGKFLFCGMLVMIFELLIVSSAHLIISAFSFNLTEKDYAITVPLIYCVSFLLILGFIFVIIMFVGKNSEEGDDD